jgi:methyltransferase (TIGR00027 family)
VSVADGQWDIVTSIGFTALLVAAGRAVETHREDGLVDDPWAERFVDEADTAVRLPTRPDQHWPAPDDPSLAEDTDRFWDMMSTYQGVRSRYFDTALTQAARNGADQVVLVAAGLDSRAYRLPWPGGVTVYEVDQPAVLSFKDEVLRKHDAQPQCERRTIGVDLREDWQSALLEAGFDPQRPSIWLLEGLLPFLPPQAEYDLLAAIDRLAAPGSTAAIEHFATVFEHFTAQHPQLMSSVGVPFGVDMASLPSKETRPHPGEQLSHAGWTTASTSNHDATRDYGRELPALTSGMSVESSLITAQK